MGSKAENQSPKSYVIARHALPKVRPLEWARRIAPDIYRWRSRGGVMQAYRRRSGTRSVDIDALFRKHRQEHEAVFYDHISEQARKFTLRYQRMHAFITEEGV
jgi:hypothetical protein